MKTITVYIDQDYLTLGGAATQDDLDAYANNLANHLGDKFPGKSFDVEQVLNPRDPCPGDEAVSEYVRDLQRGDGWLDLL